MKFDPKGNPVSGLGTTLDITDRKFAEIARQATEEELRVLSAQLLSAEERERKRIARGIHDGIGQALAVHAAELGAQIILHGRNVEKLEKVYDQIRFFSN